MRPDEALGRSMEQLTDGMPEKHVEAIKLAESVLCTIFNRQFTYGTEKCYRLRLALVKLAKDIDSRREGDTLQNTQGKV